MVIISVAIINRYVYTYHPDLTNSLKNPEFFANVLNRCDLLINSLVYMQIILKNYIINLINMKF